MTHIAVLTFFYVSWLNHLPPTGGKDAATGTWTGLELVLRLPVPTAKSANFHCASLEPTQSQPK
ncbi:MAG: hypothetical protein AAFV45_10175 [Pseudomonadota bacterium]